jgi:hypothetical protein
VNDESDEKDAIVGMGAARAGAHEEVTIARRVSEDDEGNIAVKVIVVLGS